MFYGKRSSAEFVQNNEDESTEDDALFASSGSEFEIGEHESDSSEGSVDEDTSDVAGEHIDQNAKMMLRMNVNGMKLIQNRVELHFKEKKHFI